MDESKTAKEIRRYAFLSSYQARTGAEEAEVQELQARYESLTGWPVLPRRETSDQELEDAFGFNPKRIRQ